jgi:UDPglucose 6-dehydrogenase
VEGTIIASDIIFVSVNTPTKLTGIGAGRAANIKNCELCARTIAKVSTSDKIGMWYNDMSYLCEMLSVR